MESKIVKISTDSVHNQTEKTNIVNIKIPNSSYYYSSQFNKSWIDDNPMSYALDLAIESYFGDVLSFPLDRIIYASNDFTFMERETKNDGSLNLPYMSYYRVGYSEPDRPWWNNFANLQYPLTEDNQMVKLGEKFKVFPIKVEYESVICFSQHKDLEYAYRKLAFENSNETILYPFISNSKGDIIKNIAILSMDIEFNPSYNESDWLTNNKIFTIGLDFDFDTFFIMDASGEDMFIAEDIILNFISAKQLTKPNILDSPPPREILLNYFNK